MKNHFTEVGERGTLQKEVKLKQLTIGNEYYFMISNSDTMRPFFMSIVSDSNHWMFISSNGGLTAGRKNSDFALFPYYTDDKITESAEVTGSKTIFRIKKNNTLYLWEPFSERYEGMYRITRNLYKNLYGNKIIFEEINHDLELTFQYQWNSSGVYGFVRKSTLINKNPAQIEIAILDGIQNIMPFGVGSDLQNQSSNLVDAYKRSELIKDKGLAIYALSAIIVDKAEPSEALKANIVWSMGLENPKYLLSSLQVKNFRKKGFVEEEIDVKAEKGAYFLNSEIVLPANNQKEWMLIADVNQDHADIARILHTIKSEKQLENLVNRSIEAGSKRLTALNAGSDGLQQTADKLRDARHFSNSLFNIMRGGIFDRNYQIEKGDFSNYLSKANKHVFKKVEKDLAELPDAFSLSVLKAMTARSRDNDFIRLSLEYLPLMFSRRHGDPSRPWNKFSINTESEIDGSKILDYQGNWRDIFQNWEALVHSYPGFIENMIYKFLNASTFDGYNPYRVTKDGFDWETIEHDNPWSYIGYWGDHQIIYLQKFLEFIENCQPGKLEDFFDKDVFVYANVPYKIKKYRDILKNPKDTIEFDENLDKSIREKRSDLGADGALLCDENGLIVKVNFIEKILATTLAKLSNFIPEGGIWMNTQRPEWNDANNALVGNGVSMVTLYYLRRFLNFFKDVLAQVGTEKFEVSEEIADFFNRLASTLKTNQHLLSGRIDDKNRKRVLDGLAQAGSDYRDQIYTHAFSGRKKAITAAAVKDFVAVGLGYLEHSIKTNKRADNLYHAYNLMTANGDSISMAHLDEMLEGQVAALSSKYLSSGEVLSVLDAMKQSRLFRPDQYSYLLYPKKELKGFLDRNKISGDAVSKSVLLKQLITDGNVQIIEKDIFGVCHFNGNFKNANDLKAALKTLSETSYKDYVKTDSELILQIFEEVFNHKEFTGRSGTFYGYEGLGSIYWHMVSKLQLAVQECCLEAIEKMENPEVIDRLIGHYYEINEGIGVHKSPALYGAFPTDPYSHTPAGKGAQQPGMTGQVKEDILSRYGELGVFVKEGNLYFSPGLLRRNEFLEKVSDFEYVDVNFNEKKLQLEAGSLCFTFCQTPIIYRIAEKESLTVVFDEHNFRNYQDLKLDFATSKKVFERTGEVEKIIVEIKVSRLR